ncbi:MAG: hypothetical protein KGJ37_05525, partial [Verrucomicrobiota bacterium]|nr:hypothetical protein [Verrucomicrobiota bacterium]
ACSAGESISTAAVGASRPFAGRRYGKIFHHGRSSSSVATSAQVARAVRPTISASSFRAGRHATHRAGSASGGAFGLAGFIG